MKDFFKCLLLSITISILLIFIFSIILSKTSIGEETIKPFIIGTCFISTFIGAFYMSKIKKEKGLINGGIISISYIALLYFISAIVSHSVSLSINSIILIIIGLLGGLLGGIIGVNFK